MDKSIVKTFLKQVSHFDKHPLNTRPVFMDDNARPHRAHVVTDYLRDESITTLPWPARSPDLNRSSTSGTLSVVKRKKEHCQFKLLMTWSKQCARNDSVLPKSKFIA
jgi:hypothetical protein